jgi:hypothetical protein
VKEQDILKFGRARLKVIKVNIANLNEHSPNAKVTEVIEAVNLSSLDISKNNIKDANEDEPTCRICFIEGILENPLISV